MNIAKMRAGSSREGGPYAKMIRLMQEAGYNEGITFEEATVTKVAPNLAIRIPGDPFDLSGDEIRVANHLLEHKRHMSINGAADVEVTVRSPLVVGDHVSVAVTQGGQLYYVMDKV